MKRLSGPDLGLMALVVLIVSSGPAAAFAVDALDDAGQTVHLSQPAGRVVTLAPHLAELVFAAGGGDHLVGTVEYSNFPPAAASVPRVGDAAGIDLERILALRADLVVAWGNGTDPRTVQGLEHLGIPVYVADTVRPGDVARHLRQLGKLMGTREGEAAARAFELRLDGLRRRYQQRPDLGVFVQIERTPLMTVGAGHIISNLVRLCGGHNVFAAVPGLTPAVDREALLRADPDLILALGPGAQSWLREWRRWPQMRAVKQGRLETLPEDWLARPGPRLVLGAERLCELMDAARPAGHSTPP
jgi:iron complex transport system substrate-binding protein